MHRNTGVYLKLVAVVCLLGLGGSCSDDTAAKETTGNRVSQNASGTKATEGRLLEPKTIERNPKWAKPIERPGLPNLHQIEDDLYRGVQPEPEGFVELKKMGVKTIINLRSMHSDIDEIHEAGLSMRDFKLVDIPMFAWHATDEDVALFLKNVLDKDNRPVFFHCHHGADRTGTMAAVYRVVVQGWSREEAIKEMVEGGYNFHSVWTNLITYMKGLDVKRIKVLAGLAPKAGDLKKRGH